MRRPEVIDLNTPEGKSAFLKAQGQRVPELGPQKGPASLGQIRSQVAMAKRELSELSQLVFVVPGKPMAKPRMTRRDKWKQSPRVVRYRQWADHARNCAGPLPPPENIERLDWVAYFEPPKSWSKAKRSQALGMLHRSKPDRDNVDKAILDTLFNDDSAIASGTIEKRWGSPARVEVTITKTA